jgi:hypothetical protein
LPAISGLAPPINPMAGKNEAVIKNGKEKRIMELVNIIDGKLIIGKRHFPLTSTDVDVEGFNYSGPAGLDKNKIRIVMSPSTVYDFEIGEATQESIDYTAGFERALTQKRMYVPAGSSSDFYYGLLDGHKSKK